MSTVDQEALAPIRAKYEVLDRIIKNVQYDGSAIQAESWQAFCEIAKWESLARQLGEALAAAVDDAESGYPAASSYYADALAAYRAAFADS